jgi:hypothetical protein
MTIENMSGTFWMHQPDQNQESLETELYMTQAHDFATAWLEMKAAGDARQCELQKIFSGSEKPIKDENEDLAQAMIDGFRPKKRMQLA